MRYYIQEENWLLMTKKRFTCSLAQRKASSGVRGVGKTARINSSSSSSSVRGARLLRSCSASVTLTGRSPGWTHFSREVVDIERGRFSSLNIFLLRFKISFFLKIQWTFFVTKFSSVVRCVYVSSLEWNEDDPPPVFVVSNRPRTGFFCPRQCAKLVRTLEIGQKRQFTHGANTKNF